MVQHLPVSNASTMASQSVPPTESHFQDLAVVVVREIKSTLVSDLWVSRLSCPAVLLLI